MIGMEVSMTSQTKSTHKKFKKDAKKTIYSQFEYNKKKRKEISKEKETAMEAVSKVLGLPADVLAGAPIITAYGRNELVIENYKSIIEYNGTLIKVQTKLCRIVIEGVNLNIVHFNNDEMKITGIIHSILYK